jgi:hypothetical protein
MKIILGDMNAKLGKEIWPGIAVVICVLHDACNDSRRCLINCPVIQRVFIGGMLYSHRNIYKGTWHGPDDRNANQVNRVMSDQRHRSASKGSYRPQG